ncbi:hypothetical protein B0H11DRAFT_1924477 [Mycena galericulata]|nr:hypothetical protein B0H11DRAFT_1924477 [Mycena galericulata]
MLSLGLTRRTAKEERTWALVAEEGADYTGVVVVRMAKRATGWIVRAQLDESPDWECYRQCPNWESGCILPVDPRGELGKVWTIPLHSRMKVLDVSLPVALLPVLL